MINNDIMRRVRYIFDFDDDKMMKLFALADYEATRADISDWLKKDDDPAYKPCNDKTMAIFLNGLINFKRGKREGKQPEPEKQINNNIVLKKLKIALNLKSDDMLEIMELVDFNISQHELSAFFRKETHKHYRTCKDQVLRNLLKGLQVKHRGTFQAEPKVTTPKTEDKPSGNSTFTWKKLKS